MVKILSMESKGDGRQGEVRGAQGFHSGTFKPVLFDFFTKRVYSYIYWVIKKNIIKNISIWSSRRMPFSTAEAG